MFKLLIVLVLIILYNLYSNKSESFTTTIPSNYPNKSARREVPECNCPECVLAQSTNTMEPDEFKVLRSYTNLQCVKGNSGGPIHHRNHYNEFGRISQSNKYRVPVNEYDFAFYKS